MDRIGYHRQAINMLGWIFGWYRHNKNGHYKVPDGFQVHHIDGDYTNNSLDNLAILTVEEHFAIHKEDRIKCGGHNKRSILCVETGVVYESIHEASRQTGYQSITHIGAVCRGKRKTAGGFHWEYVDDEG